MVHRPPPKPASEKGHLVTHRAKDPPRCSDSEASCGIVSGVKLAVFGGVGIPVLSLLEPSLSLLGNRDPGIGRILHRGLHGAGPSHFAFRLWTLSTDLATYIKEQCGFHTPWHS